MNSLPRSRTFGEIGLLGWRRLPPRLRPSGRPFLVVTPGILHDIASVQFLDGPGRREAAAGQSAPRRLLTPMVIAPSRPRTNRTLVRLANAPLDSEPRGAAARVGAVGVGIAIPVSVGMMSIGNGMPIIISAVTTVVVVVVWRWRRVIILRFDNGACRHRQCAHKTNCKDKCSYVPHDSPVPATSVRMPGRSRFKKGPTSRGSSAPILFGFALHGRRIRIDLQLRAGPILFGFPLTSNCRMDRGRVRAFAGYRELTPNNARTTLDRPSANHARPPAGKRDSGR